MIIKSFSIFESRDNGYFLDLEEQISEIFPTLRIETYSDINSGAIIINFRKDSDIDFIELVKTLEFWIEVLDNGGYKYSGGQVSLRTTYLSNHGIRDRNCACIYQRFKRWIDMKKYTLQFGGREYSSINHIKINFN